MPQSARAALAGLCAGVLITGCTKSSTAEACPVTRPTDKAVPAGVSAQRYGPVFGQGALWVGAWWADRSFLEQVRTQRQYDVKYPSFTVRDGEVTDASGPPRIRAERLDGKGSASGSTGGYATATQDGSGATLHWWPTVVEFSGSGCWRVTETVADTSITYVVKI